MIRHHLAQIFSLAWAIEIGVSFYWKRRANRAERYLMRRGQSVISDLTRREKP
jgi:hypothetical protein